MQTVVRNLWFALTDCLCVSALEKYGSAHILWRTKLIDCSHDLKNNQKMNSRDLMIVTPFGVGCRACKKGLRSALQSIRLHFRDNHKKEERPSSEDIRWAVDRWKDLQHLKGSYWRYIHPDREAFVLFCCSSCPFSSLARKHANRHIKRNSCKGHVLERTSYLGPVSYTHLTLPTKVTV